MKRNKLYLLRNVIGGGKSFCFALALTALALTSGCSADPADTPDTRTLTPNTRTDSTQAADTSGMSLTVDTTWADTLHYGGDAPTFNIPDSIPLGDAGEAW
jgi:hypothetical protein